MTDPSHDPEPLFAVYQGGEVTLLEELEAEVFFGVDCLGGTSVSMGKQDWRAGLKVRIPVTTVTRIFEYESREHHRTVLSNHYAQKAVENGA